MKKTFFLKNLLKKVLGQIIGNQIMNVELVSFVIVHLIIQLLDYIIGMCNFVKFEFSQIWLLSKIRIIVVFSSRNCGRGVCEPCSPKKRPVPERDWLTPVRICKLCDEAMNESTSGRS